MTILDVYLNDRHQCRAGVGADGVLTAIVSWVKLTGPAARTARRSRRPLEETRLHVGGLAGGTHRSWIERRLRAGDRVTIVVERARRADRPPRRRRADGPRPDQQTRFLNVDLDIRSRRPLEPLVEALAPAAFALHVGRDGGRYVAHLEATIAAGDADRLIHRFTRAIDRLPAESRRVWDRAEWRQFNIGIQAAGAPHCYELPVAPASVQAAARVGAGLGVTVYSPGGRG
jgi:hypothetical protein